MNTLSAYLEQNSHELPRRDLKVGLWMNESFDWYLEEDRMSHPEDGIRTLLQSFTKNQISYSKFTIKNISLEKKFPKIFFHYENAFERQAVAFYSPNEQAIIHVSPESVALLGGIVKGRGIAQYCIQGKGGLYENGCFKSLREGTLFYSPLAKGEVTSIFTLESEILPLECVEVVAWAINANTKEEAISLNRKLVESVYKEI